MPLHLFQNDSPARKLFLFARDFADGSKSATTGAFVAFSFKLLNFYGTLRISFNVNVNCCHVPPSQF